MTERRTARSHSAPIDQPRPLRVLPRGDAFGRLRIAVLAPPWIPVPPPGYGGIEAVVQLLCEALVTRGHEVTLFAAPGSRTDARVIAPLESAHPDKIGSSLFESDHVACTWDEIESATGHGVPFDVVHDHHRFAARCRRSGCSRLQRNHSADWRETHS